ncbi:MAG: SBBP repeat-containing protein [Bacteroidota bacterium]
MKKQLFSLLFTFCFIYSSYSQNWDWANGAGGNQKVEAYSIAIDDAGNSYITGSFEATLNFGSVTLTASVAGNIYASDVFIAKYNSLGALVWAQKAGSTSYDYGNGIATDAAGNVYVTGLFMGTATFGSLTVTSSADYDIFIAKYDSSGNALWVKKAGGSGWDVGSGVSIDNTGNCYITGSYRNTGTFGGTTLTSAGSYDAYVAKLDNAGTFLWAKSLGGISDDRGISVSTDQSNNCYMTGYFIGTLTSGTTTITSAGGSDMYMAKFDASGNPVWAKRAGSDMNDEGTSITTDVAGNLYVTGYFKDTAVFDSITVITSGAEDIFVGKFDYKGDVIWLKKYGGTQNDRGYGISLDSSSNIYVAGAFFGTGQFDTITAVSYNQDDAFIAGINNLGKTKWVKSGGGINADIGRSVAASAYGSCYTTGYYSGSAEFGTNTISGVSDNDLFVAKLDSTFIIAMPDNTGIDGNMINAKNITVYPNPSKSDITILLETANNIQLRVELYDVLGKIVTDKAVISETKNSFSKKQISINRGSLPDGIYFGKVIAGDQVYTTRLMLIK